MIALVPIAGAMAHATIQLPEPVKNEVSVYAIVIEPQSQVFNGLIGLFEGVYGVSPERLGPPSAAFLPYVTKEATPPMALPGLSGASTENPYARLFSEPAWSPGLSGPSSYGQASPGFGSPYAESGYRPSYAPPPVSSYGPEPVIGSENLESWGYRPQGTRGD